MKTYFTVLLNLQLFICSFNINTQTTNNTDVLTNEINTIYNEGNFNGFAVSIVNENGVVYKKGFGFADVSSSKKYTQKTIQNIASVSKLFVGIALLKAQELGKLNIDDPINKYLPFKVFNPLFPNEDITIRQLATHTSSITDNEFYLSKNYYLLPNQKSINIPLSFDGEQVFNPADSIMSMSAYLEHVLSKNGKWNHNSFSNHKPSKTYEYSNIETALAAYIVEIATKETLEHFTKKYILQPLKNERFRLEI